MDPVTVAVLAPIVTPLVAQGFSWVVKKTPWGWDDTLFGWCVKNKEPIKQAAGVLIKGTGNPQVKRLPEMVKVFTKK